MIDCLETFAHIALQRALADLRGFQPWQHRSPPARAGSGE
jgi:hypothetical protein